MCPKSSVALAVAAEGPAPANPAYREAFGPAPWTEAPERRLAAVVFLARAPAAVPAPRQAAASR
ncbi:MAG: hypothetical protein ACNA8S_07105 [Deferrisomatales bacterium]